MKVVILASGYGTRISEESHTKPMIEIAGRPILWHIMNIYSFYGLNDFIVCCGYRGFILKEYFANYYKSMKYLNNFHLRTKGLKGLIDMADVREIHKISESRPLVLQDVWETQDKFYS